MGLLQIQSLFVSVIPEIVLCWNARRKFKNVDKFIDLTVIVSIIRKYSDLLVLPYGCSKSYIFKKTVTKTLHRLLITRPFFL